MFFVNISLIWKKKIERKPVSIQYVQAGNYFQSLLTILNQISSSLMVPAEDAFKEVWEKEKQPLNLNHF